VQTKFKVGQAGRIVAVVLVLLFLMWGNDRLNPFIVGLLHVWGINVILAVSFNLIYGYTGQFSLGHAGLAAVGGYTIALLTMSPETKQLIYLLEPCVWPVSEIQLPFVAALLVSGLLGAVVGFLIGVPALTLRGDYLVIATLGFSEIIRLFFVNTPGLCNGALGLKNVPTQAGLGWTWGLAILTILVTKALVDSSYGRALRAIREDEVAAEAVGVNLSYHKLMSFVVSAFFAAVGGALLVELWGSVDPSVFTTAFNTGVITIVVLGGVGSITGSVIAAGIFTGVSELLRAAEYPRTVFGIDLPAMPGLRTFLFACLLLLLILYYRRGLMGRRELSWDAIASRVQSWMKRRTS